MDFRCGHLAQALIVQTELKLAPHSGVTVVFRSKRSDRLRILVRDGADMVMIYKALEKGSFAWLPLAREAFFSCRAGNSLCQVWLEWPRCAESALCKVRIDSCPQASELAHSVLQPRCQASMQIPRNGYRGCGSNFRWAKDT